MDLNQWSRAYDRERSFKKPKEIQLNSLSIYDKPTDVCRNKLAENPDKDFTNTLYA